jgi:hypothetical protein
MKVANIREWICLIVVWGMGEIISGVIQVPLGCRLEISLPKIQMIEVVVVLRTFELNGQAPVVTVLEIVPEPPEERPSTNILRGSLVLASRQKIALADMPGETFVENLADLLVVGIQRRDIVVYTAVHLVLNVGCVGIHWDFDQARCRDIVAHARQLVEIAVDDIRGRTSPGEVPARHWLSWSRRMAQ